MESPNDRLHICSDSKNQENLLFFFSFPIGGPSRRLFRFLKSPILLPSPWTVFDRSILSLHPSYLYLAVVRERVRPLLETGGGSFSFPDQTK